MKRTDQGLPEYRTSQEAHSAAYQNPGNAPPEDQLHVRSYSEAKGGWENRFERTIGRPHSISVPGHYSQQVKRRIGNKDEVNTFLAGMAKGIKRIIVNARHQNPNTDTRLQNPEIHPQVSNAYQEKHNGEDEPSYHSIAKIYLNMVPTGPKERSPPPMLTVREPAYVGRTSESDGKQIRQQYDANGISNFHRGTDGEVIRTNSGHPRCNYCFIASHPRDLVKPLSLSSLMMSTSTSE